MSVRRFIALLCLIAGSFGSGTVAALDCTITMGRSCEGVDNVFNIDAQFPLDGRSHLVFVNRGAEECRLVAGPGTDAWRGDMHIPGRGETTSYNPGHYRLSSVRQCDLSIRGDQDSPPPPPPPPHSPPVRVRIVTVGCDASLTAYCDGRKAPVKVTGSYPNPMWTDANGMLNLDHGLLGSGAKFYLDFEGLYAHGGAICSAHVGPDVSQGTTVTLRCSKPSIDVRCPPTGSFSDGQTIGDGWRVSIRPGQAAKLSGWDSLQSRPGSEPETTEFSCRTNLGSNVVSATKVIPGKFWCSGTGPLTGPLTCHPL